DRVIDVDMRALRKVAGWLSRVRVVARRVDAHALVEEFSRTSMEEIDYLHEASNADRFAENFAREARVRVPRVVWERTTRRVLTLEDVTAIKINDIDGLRAAGISPREVADAFAAVMFDQLFEHGFFHADPHPGNIFVTPRVAGAADASAPPWRLTFIDFGMMGEAPDALRHGLRRLMIAAAARDGKGMVASISELGVLLPSANGAELERALTALFARFGGMGFAELARVDQREFVAFGHEFGDVVREMPFQLPENFLLIIRAMSLTSGMCSALDPAFNIWDAIEPYASRLIREERGNLVQDLVQRSASELGSIARLPRRVNELVDFIEDGHIEVKTPRLDQRLDRLERAARRVAGSVIFAAFFVGGILLRVESEAWGAALMIVSGIPLLYSVLAGILSRTGRGRRTGE
ncbi:MAG: AarF/ABC1/UbiB kinase family protein, partial [Microthrixaceae bacterium]|nr:AarF/ABC1/UbiB kinase family protein [Microthrixaceae bacterium]